MLKRTHTEIIKLLLGREVKPLKFFDPAIKKALNFHALLYIVARVKPAKLQLQSLMTELL
jgi:hypothetical protein